MAVCYFAIALLLAMVSLDVNSQSLQTDCVNDQQYVLVDSSKANFFFSTNTSNDPIHDAQLNLDECRNLLLHSSVNIPLNVTLRLTYETSDNVTNDTNIISVTFENSTSKQLWSLKSCGKNAGHVTLVLKVDSSKNETCWTNSSTNAYIRFQVYHSAALNVFSDIIGWMYFVAWSISFYPQVYLNFKRKSVIGLNFDFVGLNLAGFLCYSVYNVGLYWINPIKDSFVKRNPHDIIPVQVNDVVFALHAFLLTLITAFQILIYERGDQRISIIGRGLLLACFGAALCVVVIAAIPGDQFDWLDMVSGLSYIKLAITIIKYVPQAWMNFRRKSTIGWSIGNVLLDFTGGSGSILQMFILAFNFNDWASIFLNPVKFGLGAFSILFDLFFIVQHYCLYRQPKLHEEMIAAGYQPLDDEQEVQTPEVENGNIPSHNKTVE